MILRSKCIWIRPSLIAINVHGKFVNQAFSLLMSSDSDRTGRLFFALWPDEQTAGLLAQRQAVLEGARHTHARDFHLTLAFLGVQPMSQLAALQAVVEQIEFSAISMTLNTYGEFARQKVVWAGMTDVPESLRELRVRLLAMPALSAVSFRREAGFVPHVTLARKAALPRAGFEPIHWTARRIALATSQEAGTMPRYRLLACRDV